MDQLLIFSGPGVAKILNKLGLKYKNTICINCDFEMLNYLCDNFKGGIHVSLE